MYEWRSAPQRVEDLAARSSDHSMDIAWIGLNALARPSDPDLPVTLSAYGAAMRLRGDAAVLACLPPQQIIAWVWVRTGPYLERAGSGFLAIPQSVHVVRDFKVHPDMRRRGLGYRILAELGRRWLVDRASTTIAFVAPDNVPSVRAIEHAGLTRVATVSTRRIAGNRLVTTLPLHASTRP
jgi:GNAT superfamily N-acetyltransferase